jgi:RNA polymerase sigma-70 factor (ECF subfamily)
MTHLAVDDVSTAVKDLASPSVTTPDDKELVQQCRAGDAQAFATLVKRYEKKVYWIAYNLVGSAEDARDLAQEAFLRVYRSLAKFDERYGFYTWLYRIAVNLSIDHLRKKGKGETVSLEEFPVDPAGDSPPDKTVRDAELNDRIQRTLNALPAKYKAVIVLRDVEEMACEDIAKIINCTNATTRWRLHKARELFRDRWQRFGYEAP